MRSLVVVAAVFLSLASAQPKPVASTGATPSPPAPAARSTDPAIVACEDDLDRCFDAVKVLRADAARAEGARVRWDAGCRREDGKDCFRLGLLAPLGENIAPFTRSCDLGLMEGCYALGFQFEMANDISPNPRAAAAAEALYRKSCDGGFSSGCLSLATRLDGSDEELALLDRACAMKEPIGCDRARQERCARGVSTDCPTSDPDAVGGVLGGEMGGMIAPPPPPPPAP